jgi:hypothetical protein
MQNPGILDRKQIRVLRRNSRKFIVSQGLL